MTNVFVYGTLLFPEVVEAVTGKNFRTENAVLNDYKKFQIYDGNTPRLYPAITPEEGATVEGKVLFDVDNESMRRLAHFEDEGYRLVALDVLVDGSCVTAMAYVWASDRTRLKGEWDPLAFEKDCKEEYMTKIVPKIMETFK